MEVIYGDFTECYGCSGKPEKGLFAFARLYEWKQKKSVTLFPVCKICFEMDCAVVEADAEGRRYTNIGIGNPFSKERYFFNGDRCVCGAVSVANLSGCIRCDIENRMLGKKQHEANLLKKMLVDLRREIRDQKNLLNQGA